jgi:hypothetical protein
LLGDVKGCARADITRCKDIDIVLEAPAIEYEQETGVDLARELPQIVPINNYASAKESFILRTARPWFPRG